MLNEKTNTEILEEYLENKTEDLKQKVILKFSYIVKTIAIQMRCSYQSCADMDDIVNEGIIALIGAIEKFDVSKNVKFESYASLRVRGAIIDYVRKQYWAPRRISKLSKEIDNAQSSLYNVYNRYPTDNEMAEYMGITLPEYLKAIRETNNANLLSFDALIYENQKMTEVNITKSNESKDLPESKLIKKETIEELEFFISQLNEKEKYVISLYYKNDLSIKQIAKILSVSEPRVSQIHSNALRKLKVYMKKYMEA